MMARGRSWLGKLRGGPEKKSRLSTTKLGVVVLMLAMLAGLAAFSKERIATTLASLSGAETVSAEFERQYKLIGDAKTYVARVKMAGVTVGKVTNVEQTDRGTALVTMQVDEGVREKLGDSPSAAIRPTLVVGGIYFIDLTSGGRGEFGEDPIPLERTSVPVELDAVLSAVSSPDAKKGIQSAVKQTDATLAQGGTEAARGLLQDAPATLRPAGEVLTAARGTDPSKDLTRLVTGLESTAVALNRNDDQLGSILDSLDASTAALAAGSEPLAESIANGPETMRVTRAGLEDLQPTLEQLTTTAETFRPTAQELDPLLAEAIPVLDRARPVVNDLRLLAQDARPLVERLVPTVDDVSTALDDVKGPALDRINGPIKDMVFSPWKGSGVYEGGGSNNVFYKETGYLISDSSAVFDTHDQSFALGRLEAGAGGKSIGGSQFPMTLEQYLEQVGLQRPIGPQEGPNSQVEDEADSGRGAVGEGLFPPSDDPGLGGLLGSLGQSGGGR